MRVEGSLANTRTSLSEVGKQVPDAYCMVLGGCCRVLRSHARVRDVAGWQAGLSPLTGPLEPRDVHLLAASGISVERLGSRVSGLGFWV